MNNCHSTSLSNKHLQIVCVFSGSRSLPFQMKYSYSNFDFNFSFSRQLKKIRLPSCLPYTCMKSMTDWSPCEFFLSFSWRKNYKKNYDRLIIVFILKDPAGIFDLVEVVGNGTYGQVHKVSWIQLSDPKTDGNKLRLWININPVIHSRELFHSSDEVEVVFAKFEYK